MQEKKADNSISAQAADKLIAAHDGDVALLYIYIARTGCLDMERAAHDLCRTMREISAAEEKLRRMELIPAAQAQPFRPARRLSEPQPMPEAEVLPEYRAEDIARRSREDGAFSVILAEAAKVIGHSLSGNDMRILFGIYDYLALPAEVILELLNYCGELFLEKYGTGRRPSARAIEKEAYTWVNREILTLEQAEEYIHAQKARRSDIGRIKAALDIRGRELTASEVQYISAWLDMGFGEDAVAIAYDRTVTGTGSLKWPYMNTIMKNWHAAGLHSPEEIREKDSRRRSAAAPASPGSGSIDMDELRKAINKI